MIDFGRRRRALARAILGLSLLLPLAGCELFFAGVIGATAIPVAVWNKVTRDERSPKRVRAQLVLVERAACGDLGSQDAAGTNYSYGKGTEANLEEAYFWYGLAARQGFRSAALKRDDLAGELTPEQRAEVDARLAAWAPRDCPPAGDVVGERAEYLSHVKRAPCGNRSAQRGLAHSYRSGYGTDRSPKDAYFWFGVLEKQGERRADVARDELGEELTAEARAGLDAAIADWRPRECARTLAPWLRSRYLANLEWASCGYQAAQFDLARLLQQGRGVAEDPQEAYFWYSLLLHRGQLGVTDFRDDLAEDLTPELRAELDARVEAWTPNDCPDYAAIARS